MVYFLSFFLTIKINILKLFLIKLIFSIFAPILSLFKSTKNIFSFFYNKKINLNKF